MPTGVYQHKRGYKRPPFSKKWKIHISEGLKGRETWNKGKGWVNLICPICKKSVRVRGCHHLKYCSIRCANKNLRIAQKGVHNSPKTEFKSGNKHSGWKGGIGNKPYPFNFNNELRELIRRRDNHICQKCGVEQNGRLHSVHHINYDKKDLNPLNLITFCNRCNSVVNFNRMYWQIYFENKVKEVRNYVQRLGGFEKCDKKRVKSKSRRQYRYLG